MVLRGSDVFAFEASAEKIQNADQFLAAGAIAVGISSHLFSPEAIAEDDWTTIIARSRALIQKVQPFQNQ